MSELLAEQVFREAGESIDVLSPPLDAVVAEARAVRRRRRRTVLVGIAAAAVVVAGTTWLTTRPPPADQQPGADREPGVAVVTRSPNPVDVAWYAGGLLHLDDVTVTLPQLTDLAEVSTGAVYADTTGAVSFVRADGERRLLGQKDPDAPLVVSPGNGWATWVDAGGDVPQLVVYDVYAGRLLDRLLLTSRDSRPLAIDQDRVFYATPDGEFSWAPPDEEPAALDRGGLLDVEAATRAYQTGADIELVQPLFSVSYVVPGRGARLSLGGSHALSEQPSDRPEGEPYEPLLYDVRSGERLPSGVRPDELVYDATFGRSSVVYLVAQRADLEGGADLDGNVDPLLVLRVCDLATRRCTDIVPVPTTGEVPLLAQ